MSKTRHGLLLAFYMALALPIVAEEKETQVTDTRQFTTATYRVAMQNQEAFLELLKGCEGTMRELGLISDRPAIRMRSLADPELLLEIFEWADAEAFGRTQKEPRVLEWWGKYEATWIRGGFGLTEFPEASQSWAQFKTID